MKIAVGLIHYPILDSRKNIVATNVTNLDVHDIARACRVYGIERYYIIHPMQDQLMFVSRMLEHWRIGDGAKFNPMRRTALTMVHTAPSLEAAISDWGGNPYVISTHARALDGVPSIGFRDLHDRICRARQIDSLGAPLPPASRLDEAHQWSGLEKNQGSRVIDALPTALLAPVESLSALNRMTDLALAENNSEGASGVRSLPISGLRSGLSSMPSFGADGAVTPRAVDTEERIFLCFGTGFGLTEETMRACDYLLEPIRGASSDDYRHLSVRSAVSICLDRLFGPW